MNKLLFAILLVSLTFSLNAQLVVSNLSATADQLVDELVGTGVTWSNASFTGSSNGSSASNRGFFNNGSSIIGINKGIIISSGNVLAAGQANTVSYYTWENNLPGDASLNTIVSPTMDAAVLQFEFIPQSNYIQFKYVFASEEYNEWVGDVYNDVFGFFVTSLESDGYNYSNKNIALIPGTSTPVSINNVNLTNNSAYYINNESGARPIEYDGMTTVLTASCYVTPCKRYRIKIAVADVSDMLFDSSVMLESNSFISPIIDQVDVSYSNPSVGGGNQMVEGCSNAIITLNLNSTTPIDRTVQIILGGTATYGVDYSISPGWFTAPNIWNVTIPAGQSSITFTVTPSMDGLTEGTETVTMQIQSNLCPPYTYISGSSNILDDAMSFSFNILGSPPPGTVITNPPDPTTWGRTGGTIQIRNLNWPVCVNWGFPGTIGAVNCNYSGGTPTYSNLIFDSGDPNTNLANGNACLKGVTTIKYISQTTGNFVTNTNFQVRLRIQVRTPGGTPIPIERLDYAGNTYLLIKAQNCDVTLYFEGYGPSDALWFTNYANTWAGLINIFDALHTDAATQILTQFIHGFCEVNANPIVTSNSPVCIGNPINLSIYVGTCRPLYYSWSGPNGFTSSSQNPVINNSTESNIGTYNVYAYDRICYGSGSTNVNVVVPPTTGLINTDYIWTGRISSEWNNNSNWVSYNGTNFINPASVPTSANNVYLKQFSSCVQNNPVISTADGNCKKITIDNPIILTIANNKTLNVYGDWVNNYVVDCQPGTTVAFRGNARQYVLGSSNTSFYHLTINNSGGGIVAGRDFDVLGNLTMTLGHLDLKDQIVNLSTTGQVVGENENARIRSTDASWNDGVGSGYIYAIRNNPSGNVAGLGLDFTPSVPLGNDIIVRRGCTKLQGSGSYMSNYSIFRYYAIYPVIPASGVYLTVNSFKYWGGSGNPELNGHTEANLKMFQQVQYWNGSTNPIYWEPRNTNVFVTSDYVQSSTTQNPIMLNYILITLGSESKPLPVTLLNFDANCKDNFNEISWITASEVNNLGFWVEKSKDAFTWQSFAWKIGKGNSNTNCSYNVIDEDPFYPVTYYRLIQKDIDGNENYSFIVSASCSKQNEIEENLVPLYQSDGKVFFNIFGKPSEAYQIIITDVLGRIIYSKNIQLKEFFETLPFDGIFSSGMYYVSMIKTNGEKITKSFVKF